MPFMLKTIVISAAFLFCGASAHASANKRSTMHYMRALLLEHQGNFAEALQEFRAAVASDPQSGYLVEQAVGLALRTGRADVALELAQHLVRIEPKSASARCLLGQVFWARGQMSEAKGAFEEALKLNERLPEALLALGNLLSAKSPAKAREYLQRYIAANPENAAQAHYQLAILEQRLGRAEEAIAALKAAVAAAPDNFQARLSLAQAYEAKKDTDSALAEYLALEQRDPQNAALSIHIGEIHFMRGDAASAQVHFERAKRAVPGNPAACLWLAILAEQRGDFDSAASLLQESSALKDDAGLNLRLSYYQTQANRVGAAVETLERAHRKWPANEEISYFLALGYDDLKAPEKAVELLTGVLRARPEFRDARFQLGVVYEKMNRIEEVEKTFKELIAARPNDAAALNYLGYSLADRGLKLAEAEGFIRRALALDPTNGAYHDSLGWVYFKQGLYPQAQAELRTALGLLGEDATVSEHLGDVYQVLGDSVAAWSQWKKAAWTEEAERLREKLDALESRLSPPMLGNLYLDLAGSSISGLTSYSGPCEIQADIFNRRLRFSGLLSYKSPAELRLELIGPLFTPILRARVGADDSFEMDPVHLEGISPELLEETVSRSLRLMRAYFGGRIFEGRPAVFHKGWRTEWVAAPQGQFFFDGRRQSLGSFQEAASGLRLSLDDFQARGGRRVPETLRLEGKGFSIEFRVQNPELRFSEPNGRKAERP